MMMAVQPKAGILPGLDLNLAGTGEATAEGDAFMALMASLAAPEGEAADAAPVGTEEIARQLAAMITGVVSPKAAKAAAQPETEADEAPAEDAPKGEAAKCDSCSMPTPTVLTPLAATPTVAAPTTAATVTVQAEAADAVAPKTAPAPEAGIPNMTVTPARIETSADAPTALAPALPAPAAGAAAETMPPKPVVLTDGVELPASATAAKDAVAAPAPVRADAPAPVQALQALIQLNAPALSKAFAAASASPTAKTEAPAGIRETKPAGASGFLATTILPLLPESLHAVVLGQSAPAEAAPLSEAAPALDSAEAVIEHQLDLAHEGEWLDQLAKDIARSAGKEGGLRFRLNPENLGSLRVEMTQGPAGASIRITADTEAARTIIADAQPKLIAEARANGLKVAESHVDLGSNGGQQASADARKQEDLQQQQRFVRTAAAEQAEATATPTPRGDKAAERYA